ncbi:MAG: exodeoxyribonuclease VII small subunit [Candidatus Andersenbacteria bacterium RIFCSPHIGHO2_12_FULL_45_11b]|uniref:Exodeoxyribonuclease VII small subunit n=1 Tax=Candidatus Andersenbacteria bacterium RIFCSPHIGHO2_12_FULL_45_11b TaxID=1797282 RepID=A0A1G1XBI6_9BACT|nr:MAG: exodeoxyribonuclease VII small subunit [Candidatus Andersenbacteria bacterium RIFCSPHIGHO2_12_FULL_45_11b]
MTKSEKKFDFTKGYDELEEIVKDFESRELDLEKDLPKFEQGLKLAGQLQERLKEIENTVQEIEKTYS